jgi:hypothetical protein
MRTMLVLAALAALVLAAPAGAKVRKLEAKLSGANEIPAADPDGHGEAKIRLDRAKKKVCFTIEVEKIDQPVLAAHIHKGGRNVASGDIVVFLIHHEMTGTRFTGCEKNVRRKLIRKILRHPRRYYVNVHTPAFPAGAIRGQLRRS